MGEPQKVDWDVTRRKQGFYAPRSSGNWRHAACARGRWLEGEVERLQHLLDGIRENTIRWLEHWGLDTSLRENRAPLDQAIAQVISQIALDVAQRHEGKRMYGKEMIMDLHGCDTSLFNRKDLTRFFHELCALIGVMPEDLYFWDDVGVSPEECQTDPRTKGTSAVQFILTSTITVHTLDLLGKVFINVFSCKSFNTIRAATFCQEFFRSGKMGGYHVIARE